jgi:hypothetical protein
LHRVPGRGFFAQPSEGRTRGLLGPGGPRSDPFRPGPSFLDPDAPNRGGHRSPAKGPPFDRPMLLPNGDRRTGDRLPKELRGGSAGPPLTWGQGVAAAREMGF